MKLFLYEYITGGGLLASGVPTPPSGSLLREGVAMLRALAEDFCDAPDVRVSILRDARLASRVPTGGEERVVSSAKAHAEQFDALAAESDWTVVIAPEFDRLLIDCVRRVEAVGGRLLGPDSLTVELASCKSATLRQLAAKGIRTPRGYQFAAADDIPMDFRFPAVFKPQDGAGSQGISVIPTRATLPRFVHPGMPGAASFRLEEFQSGTPISVAVLSGPKRQIVLPACEQTLSEHGELSYLGGRLPLHEPLRSRAQSLARAVVDALPSFLGYIGIDMVLGASEDSDCVIEVNPRLTTSYVGLRRATQQNLAVAMLELAASRTPKLYFSNARIEFTAGGTILSVGSGEEE